MIAAPNALWRTIQDERPEKPMKRGNQGMEGRQGSANSAAPIGPEFHLPGGSGALACDFLRLPLAPAPNCGFIFVWFRITGYTE
jgi:hypothetical protein